MARLDLARLLRGAHRRAVEELVPLLGEPVRVEDERGKTLLGQAERGDRHEIKSGGATIGAVVGGAGAERLAHLIGHLYEREQEKLALAAETLGRYKELTVLYDMSSALSRVLDVDDVSRRIVDEAHRFLRASETTLFTLDRKKTALEPLATAGGSAASLSLDAPEAIETRVLGTGQAELVEIGEGGGSVMAAPLRFGEAVFGVLRVTSRERTPWTSGDLKLVTSLAANAASAVSHALLHRDRLREQALRSQIERFVSPALLEIAAEGRAAAHGDAVAVLVCDLSELMRSLDASLSPAEVLAEILAAASVALDVLLAHDAIVGTTQGETMVAFFGDGSEFRAAAQRAAAAATALARRLASRGTAEGRPGVGIARVEPGLEDDPRRFYEGLGVAALLGAAAQGRVLCDDAVAEALPAAGHAAIEPLASPRGLLHAHEVRA